MPKMLQPNTTIWWVPAAGITDPATDLFKTTVYQGAGASAVNISCAIETGIKLNATDSEVSSVKSICDSAGVETPTNDNYEAELTFFREAIVGDAIGNSSVYDKAFALFRNKLAEGYLVKRIGWKNTDEVKVGHILSGYKVISDNPRDEIGEGEDPIRFAVKFNKQGWMKVNHTVSA